MMTSLEEALAAIRSRVRRFRPKRSLSPKRTAASSLKQSAPGATSPTDISMMDGYALGRAKRATAARRWRDRRGRSALVPAAFEGRVRAHLHGRSAAPRCRLRGHAGARSPEGATVRRAATAEGRRAYPAARRRAHGRRGSAAPGRVLDAADLALAAACGVGSVHAHRRPRIRAALHRQRARARRRGTRTGKDRRDEQLDPGRSRPRCVQTSCASEVAHPISVDRIAERLRDLPPTSCSPPAARPSATTITRRDALERLDGELIFHTVAIRPGKPVLFGTASARGSSSACREPRRGDARFELFVRLAIRLMSGDPKPARPRARARLRGTLSPVEGLTFFPRGTVSAEGSHLIFSPGGSRAACRSLPGQARTRGGGTAGRGPDEDGAEIDVLLVGPWPELPFGQLVPGRDAARDVPGSTYRRGGARAFTTARSASNRAPSISVNSTTRATTRPFRWDHEGSRTP